MGAFHTPGNDPNLLANLALKCSSLTSENIHNFTSNFIFTKCLGLVWLSQTKAATHTNRGVYS